MRPAPRPVRLFLIRHARAEARGSRWQDDRRRPLTPEGIAAFEALLRTPRLRAVAPDLVLTSGLTRAVQTARLLTKSQRRLPELRVTRALEPGRTPDVVLRALRRWQGHRRIAVVGHEPDLSLLLASLTGRSLRRPLRKGAVCQIRLRAFEAGAGRVVWMAVPRANVPGTGTRTRPRRRSARGVAR